MAEKQNRSEFLGPFKEEADDIIARLNQGLMDLESAPDDSECLHEITRATHTLKGTANMMGVEDVGQIAHRMEDVLSLVRDGCRDLSTELGDALFAALDLIQLCINRMVGIDTGVANIDENVESVCSQLIEFCDWQKEEAPIDAAETEELPSPFQGAENASTESMEPIRSSGSPLVDAFAPQSSAENIISDSKVGIDELQREAHQQVMSYQQKVEESVPPKKKKTIAPLPERAIPAQIQPTSVVQDTIRVDKGKVDELVNLSGEMVVNQIRFEDRLVKLKALYSDFKEQQRKWSDLNNQLSARAIINGQKDKGDQVSEKYQNLFQQLTHISDKFFSIVRQVSDDTVHLVLTTSELQREVMALRMAPIGAAFNMYRRKVRDVARVIGKQVGVFIEGKETELDKKMIEGINDPLIHLVRNCIDHGIESAEERIHAGKNPKGTLVLAARQEGDRILIEIKDDGRGMNPSRIKRSALEKGIITKEEAENLSARDALYLIFRPNFSTKNQVTETSGRGVGLDVVKSCIESLKGEVRVQTKEGAGTTFTLILPLTLAVSRALFVQVEGNIYALPTSSIVQTAKIRRSEVKSIEGFEAIQVRDQTIPLIVLADVLSLQSNHSDLSENISVVILEYAEEQIAFLVDGVVGEQEIVIKKLDKHLEQVGNIAGAALLGSGDVILILHIPELFASVTSVARRKNIRQEKTEISPRKNHRILVVEDSLTTRELERNLLLAQGYDVDVACDGLNGLQKTKAEKYDLIVADVSMPKLNGFQMIEELKANESSKDIPVILVTSLEKEEDRRKGFKLGAEAYVVKTSFDQTNLLDTIQRLIG